jgi:hypothetical protein
MGISPFEILGKIIEHFYSSVNHKMPPPQNPKKQMASKNFKKHAKNIQRVLRIARKAHNIFSVFLS